MSKPHLRALEEALGRRGWRVVAVHLGNDYNISASWEIQRSTSEPSLFIDFDGLDDLNCLPLEESYGCHLRGRSAKNEAAWLYFRKRNKSRSLWEQDLARFVFALENEEAADPDAAADGLRMTPKSVELMEAVSVGDLDRVRALVESGADVNARGEHGSGTLLNFHPGITAYLLSKGANPNTQTNENGASVLAGLCYVNQTECVRLLLSHGADPNRGRDESLETPLHHALAGGADIEVVRLLVDHGADVNAKTLPGVYSYNFYGSTPTRGETPLHRAAAFAPIEIVQLLLQAGADRAVRDVHGESPHVWAGWHRREKKLVELLQPS